MPGYTHMQPAKPTTFGQWALAYADALLRGLGDLRNTPGMSTTPARWARWRATAPRGPSTAR